jgi:hypothetical protein
VKKKITKSCQYSLTHQRKISNSRTNYQNMESTDIIAARKQVKNQKNIYVRSDKKMPQTRITDEESYQRLRRLFLKTEEMKEISQAKNKEMEGQFKELQERLVSSSGFLNQIKKSIENVKFAYQRDIIDLEKVTEENREDIDKQIEEIREHIGKLRSRAREERPKPQTYQEAFTDVLTTFQNIAQGKYNSQNLK